jgi:hypothetical protein
VHMIKAVGIRESCPVHFEGLRLFVHQPHKFRHVKLYAVLVFCQINATNVLNNNKKYPWLTTCFLSYRNTTLHPNSLPVPEQHHCHLAASVHTASPQSTSRCLTEDLTMFHWSTTTMRWF